MAKPIKYRETDKKRFWIDMVQPGDLILYKILGNVYIYLVISCDEHGVMVYSGGKNFLFAYFNTQYYVDDKMNWKIYREGKKIEMA